jgi:hypothetical protein
MDYRMAANQEWERDFLHDVMAAEPAERAFMGSSESRVTALLLQVFSPVACRKVEAPSHG